MKKLIFALIASAAAISAAHAEGPYVGAGVVTSRYNFDVPGTAGVITSTDDKSGYKVSGKVFAGYEFDKMWGIEGGYTDLGGKTYNFSTAGVPGSVDSGAHSYYAAGKASFPVNEQFSLFGKLGVARNHFSATGSGSGAGLTGSENKTDLYSALGGQYNINKQVALTLEWERYGKDHDLGSKSNAITAAVRYSF